MRRTMLSRDVAQCGASRPTRAKLRSIESRFKGRQRFRDEVCLMGQMKANHNEIRQQICSPARNS